MHLWRLNLMQILWGLLVGACGAATYEPMAPVPDAQGEGLAPFDLDTAACERACLRQMNRSDENAQGACHNRCYQTVQDAERARRDAVRPSAPMATQPVSELVDAGPAEESYLTRCRATVLTADQGDSVCHNSRAAREARRPIVAAGLAEHAKNVEWVKPTAGKPLTR